MEIDFMGLNSLSKNGKELENRNCISINSADEEVEISLSLGRSYSLDHYDYPHSDDNLLNIHQKKGLIFPGNNEMKVNVYKTEQAGSVLVATPVFPSAARFIYPTSHPSTMIGTLRRLDLYSSQANAIVDDNVAEKVNNTTTYTAKCLERRKNSRGHMPTVAMARRATLARFLKKRLHRMSQANSSFIR